MRPELEDIYMGQLASPSFSEGFRWEDSRRRVRVVFADMTIADSKRVMLLHEFGRLPVFYFPMEDVRMDLMEETDHHTSSPLKGEASYWTIRVGNGVAENAAGAISTHYPVGRVSKATWHFTGTKWTPGMRRRNGSLRMRVIPTNAWISCPVPAMCA